MNKLEPKSLRLIFEDKNNSSSINRDFGDIQDNDFNILLAILVTSFATYISRFLGVFTSVKINETSKIYRWFNCLAYSTLAALISRMLVFPSGDLSEVSYLLRLIVIILSIFIFYITKKNLVYPTVFSAIILSFLNSVLL